MRSAPRPLLALAFVLALFAIPFILVPQSDLSSSAALASVAPAAPIVQIEDADAAPNPPLVAPTILPARASSNSVQTELAEQSALRKSVKQGDSLFETLAKPLI
ncbi:MAG: hypothetical protein HY327_10375, partial [Chloroflexi bacterium]|nr:hypothetical protein [Chloroflexota bacterium]